MREYISTRVSEHQQVDGIMEYAVEITISAVYNVILIGASHEELIEQIATSYKQMFTLLQIPETVIRPNIVQTDVIENPQTLNDISGNPIPGDGFAAIGTAKFEAQVLRNGVVVEENPTK